LFKVIVLLLVAVIAWCEIWGQQPPRPYSETDRTLGNFFPQVSSAVSSLCSCTVVWTHAQVLACF